MRSALDLINTLNTIGADMKLHEIATFRIEESKMSEKHSDLQDAIMDEFGLEDTDPVIDELVTYLVNGEDSDHLDAFLYDHFEADMPYGTRKARDGDPSNWIADRMSEIFKGMY